jgi:hypothetical protein
VKGGPQCPTLLHYIARVLLRTDPTLVTFLEDMPHLEAAARGERLPKQDVTRPTIPQQFLSPDL